MKKVVVGGFHHESDTFNPIITSIDDIKVTRGAELLSNYSGGENALSGIVAALKGKVEIIPTLFARAIPGGVWDKEVYLRLKEEFIAFCNESYPFDAFSLALHGSMRVEEIGDAESDLLSSLKALFPSIPIFAALDMHATITQTMIDCVDAFICYKTAPHVDTFNTGFEVGNITTSYLESGKDVKQYAIKIPFLVAGEQSETSTEPMKTLICKLKELEQDDNVLSASIALGFPWADCEDSGCTTIVISYDENVAKEKAEEVASLFWSYRGEFSFCTDSFNEAEAIKESIKALDNGTTPIIISDSGDNPTAGSSQDVVSFLSLLLKEERLKCLNPPLCYNAIYDPEVVQNAFRQGSGEVIEGKLGGKFDTTKPSLPFKGIVKALNPDYKGVQAALINIDGIDVVVTSKRVGCHECELIRSLDVDVENLKVLVVKLGYLEPELKEIAHKSILALTQGSSDELFYRLDYKKLKHPLYPIDKEGNFSFLHLVR